VGVKAALVERLRREKYVDLLGEYGIELRRGEAMLLDPHTVQVGGEELSADALLYVAAAGGAAAAQNALAGADVRLDFSNLPRIIFSTPQLASAGLTEEQAREHGFEVETRLLPPDAIPRALVNADTRGLFKLVAEHDTHRLLRASICRGHRRRRDPIGRAGDRSGNHHRAADGDLCRMTRARVVRRTYGRLLDGSVMTPAATA
jgi:pyruvate/2-oxoglutarate dehydrogenase complex dihydrolipoamide dehydrogenase (E3) component